MSTTPRSRARRRRDTEHRLTHDIDLWWPVLGAAPLPLFRITPRRIQAWREVDELPDRALMRDGCCLA